MLTTTSCTRSPNQRGQVLALALVFMAFFAATIGAVLRFGDVTGTQHQRTEATATTDAGFEGGAANAAADATIAGGVPCIPGSSGKLQMTGGDTVQYKVTACNPGNSVPGFGGGTPCVLCILNDSGAAFTTTCDTAVIKYSLCDTVNLSSPGDIVVNSNVSNNGTGNICTTTTGGSLCPAASSPPPFISVYNYPTNVCTGCTTTPIGTYNTLVTDPLGVGAASGLPIPTAPSTGLCSVATPCSGGGSLSVGPSGIGVYTTISGDATFSPGVYVLVGPGASGGNVIWTSSAGVTIYLACASYPSCASGSSGGSLEFRGGGTANLSNGSGTYSGISIFADPNRTGTLLTLTGNGTAVTSGGTLDFPKGDVSESGGGNNGKVTIGGRLIASRLNIDANGGHPGNGLTLSGTGLPGNGTICTVLDETVWLGTGGPPANPGRVVIQEHCGPGNAYSGVVDLNYRP